MTKLTGLKRAIAIAAIVNMVFFLSAQAGRGKGRLTGVVVNESNEPIAGADVRIEFEKGGLKDKTTTNKKGEFAFMGLGSGFANIFASADGYLDATTQVNVRQLELNPQQKIVLKEDKEKKARIQNEASMAALDKGNQLFSEGKYDEALAAYTTFAQENPDVFQIYLNIGDCHREKQEFDKAIEQYNLGLEKAKEKGDLTIQAKALASIGEVYLRKDDLKQAQDFFKKSVDLNPKDEILAYNVAEIFFANNKVDEAIQYYQLATTIKPNWCDPYLKLGYAYLNKGDTQKAKEVFNKFVEIDPSSAQAAEVKMILESLKNIK